MQTKLNNRHQSVVVFIVDSMLYMCYVENRKKTPRRSSSLVLDSRVFDLNLKYHVKYVFSCCSTVVQEKPPAAVLQVKSSF